MITHKYQSEVLGPRSNTRDGLGFERSMVLLKMLMEIDPLSMRGSLVMTMAMIFFLREGCFPDRTAPLEP